MSILRHTLESSQHNKFSGFILMSFNDLKAEHTDPEPECLRMNRLTVCNQCFMLISLHHTNASP